MQHRRRRRMVIPGSRPRPGAGVEPGAALSCVPRRRPDLPRSGAFHLAGWLLATTTIAGLIERQYVIAISTAGAVIGAGAIVVDVGIALIPVAGAAAAGAKSAGRQAAKKAGKEAV